jgi:hypothetical protein
VTVIFTNETRRMAIIKMTGGAELIISRSKSDGSTVGVRQGGRWKTLDTGDLLDALTYVTKTDEELLAMGMPVDNVKPQKKRDYKAEYQRRKAKKDKTEDDDIFF